MVHARADATIPASPPEVFAVATDLAAADWLPAVRRLRHVGGPLRGVGSRHEAEVGLVGRHLRGVLVCREMAEPTRAVFGLDEGLDLTVTVTVSPVSGGSTVEVDAAYTLGDGPLGAALERASIGAARREAARAVE
ncbi:MAG: SRPBCC family protein, partial [Candidatus Dormibacteria bacterium]